MEISNHAAHCANCNKVLTGRQKKYCSVKCKQNILSSYPVQRDRGRNRKLLAIKEKGDKCNACGYRKNLAALSFHHLDPKKKELRLDVRHWSNNSPETLKKELEKCIVLCLNCHAELHNPELAL